VNLVRCDFSNTGFSPYDTNDVLKTLLLLKKPSPLTAFNNQRKEQRPGRSEHESLEKRDIAPACPTKYGHGDTCDPKNELACRGHDRGPAKLPWPNVKVQDSPARRTVVWVATDHVARQLKRRELLQPSPGVPFRSLLGRGWRR
jgi:hypothetical protein